MKSPTIRKTTTDDIAKIMPLIEELNLSDFPYDQDVNMKWGETKDGKKYYYPKIDGSKGICFVAEIENKPVGYLMGEINSSTYNTIKIIDLCNIYVKEKFRNQGIGKKLVNAFMKWGREIGAQKVGVAVFSANKNAIQFYEQAGFKPYSQRLEFSLVKI